MKILFIHQNFPGQFVHLSATLAADNHQVVALSMENQAAIPNVMVRRYTLLRSHSENIHPFLREQEFHILRAEACAAAAMKLKKEGFTPDLIIAHPGWGEALFIKEVFPHSRLVIYCEFYYAAEGKDVGFDPEQPALDFSQMCKLRLKNTTNLLSLEIADAAISPTLWQRSTYPEWAQKKIAVIHDGIDISTLQFNSNAKLILSSHERNKKTTFDSGSEVVTYIARNLEPVRGFHIFMRALPEVLRQRPNASAIIVGGNEKGYGAESPHGKTWKEIMLSEVGSELDLGRIYFPGQIPRQDYLQLLSISRVHAYWTTPFVLSWSFLEAAASGVSLIASDTAPVREFSDEVGAKTINFFDAKKFSESIIDNLSNPKRNSSIIETKNFNLVFCLQRQKKFIQSLF